MQISSDKTLLLIPCYNEAARLKFDSFKTDIDPSIDLFFVDDGSTDETCNLIQKFIDENKNAKSKCALYRCAKNGGKGEAIRAGMLAAGQYFNLSDYTWLGFWDADLATPLTEVRNLIIYRNHFNRNSLAIFGSRVNRYGSLITRSQIRHYLSRIFITMTSWILGG
jgi:dolichyl-phosphate beta-glucosyltransferase